MDTQLVGASGFRVKCDARVSVLAGDDLVTGDGCFPVLRHHLTWPVVDVWLQGKRNHTIVRRDQAVKDGDISFFDLSVLELLLQQDKCMPVFGYQQDAGRVHVQTVYHERAGSLGKVFLCPRKHGGRVVVRVGHRQHACGFVHGDKPFIFVKNGRFGGVHHLRFLDIGFHFQSLQHVPEYRFALGFAGRIEMAVLPDFRFGGRSPPKFGHGQRVITVAESVLQ